MTGKLSGQTAQSIISASARLRARLCLLGCLGALLLSSSSLTFSAERDGQTNSSGPLKDRWNLRLLQNQLPELNSPLANVTWFDRGARTVTGNGSDTTVELRLPPKTKSPEVTIITSTYGRAGSVLITNRLTNTFTLRVEGALIEFDGRIYTSYVLPDKTIILGVAVPLGGQRWYYLFSDRDSNGKVSFHEYLFDFLDDLREKECGLATFHSYFSFRSEVVEHIPAQFELTETWADTRRFSLRGEKTQYGNWVFPNILAPREGRYLGVDQYHTSGPGLPATSFRPFH